MVEQPRNINILDSLELPKFKLGYHLSVVEDLDLKSPMNLPFGKITSRPSGVLAVVLDIGGHISQGYGEGATLPKPVFTDDSGETISGASDAILKSFYCKGPLEIGDVLRQISDFSFDGSKRYPTARMMVEMAVLDAYAKGLNCSVGELLGLPKSIKSVHYGKSIGEGPTEEILKQCEEASGKGAKKIKLKVSPSYFEEVQAAIKILQKKGGMEVMVDANGSFDPQDNKHLAKLKLLDSDGLIMIEEPVSRVGNVKGIDAVSILRGKIAFKTPVCLDDSLVDMETTLFALNNDLADIVNIKPGRIGSIVNSIKLAKYCKSIGKEIMVGGMLEGTPGRCMTVTLAAFFMSMGFNIPGDLSLSQERLAKDLVTSENFLRYNSENEVILPTGKGWGFGEINLSSK